MFLYTSELIAFTIEFFSQYYRMVGEYAFFIRASPPSQIDSKISSEKYRKSWNFRIFWLMTHWPDWKWGGAQGLVHPDIFLVFVSGQEMVCVFSLEYSDLHKFHLFSLYDQSYQKYIVVFAAGVIEESDLLDQLPKNDLVGFLDDVVS